MLMKSATKPAEPSPRSRPARPRLTLSVQRAVRATDAPSRAQIMQFARAALERDAELTIRLVNEQEGRALNHDYRGRDYATNVLSFVYASTPVISGDLVLCAPVVSREAQQQGKPIIAHYAHLIVHGVLHLHGMDHENDDDAQAMEARETEIITGLGFANPYLEMEQI